MIDLRYLLCFSKLDLEKSEERKQYKDHSKSAMKYSQVTIPCSESLRFFALLIMCCTILVHISATESLKNDDTHETRGELPRLNREPRAIKKNGTTNLQDIEKRIQIIEQRYVLPILGKAR